MGFVQRALFTWFMILIFLILLCLRLESRITWNWLVVFTPLWFYDTILIIWVLIEILKAHASHKHLPFPFVYMSGILLKIGTQITICLKLEYNLLPLYLTFVPLWMLLSMLITFVGRNLLPRPRVQKPTRPSLPS